VPLNTLNLVYQMMRDNICEACGTCGEKRNTYRVLVGKRDGEKQIVRTLCREKDNIKICLRNRTAGMDVVQNMDIRRAVVKNSR